MSRRARLATLAVSGFLLFGPHASAQSSLEQMLAVVKTLKCTFSVVATGNWKNGEPEEATKPAALSFQFDSISLAEGTAKATGAFGASEVIVQQSVGALSFLQVFNEGGLYATTVYARESRGGKLQAVHSRHEYTAVSLPGYTSRPEQYYGECQMQQ